MKIKNITVLFLLFSFIISCNNTTLNGNFVNQKKGIYKSIEIKGNTSVVVTDGLMGIPFATSYVRDGEIIRIKTDKSDLMFTIKNNNTLVGEGFAEGTYIKSK